MFSKLVNIQKLAGAQRAVRVLHLLFIKHCTLVHEQNWTSLSRIATHCEKFHEVSQLQAQQQVTSSWHCVRQCDERRKACHKRRH
jgi:hypothetical protein